MTEQEGRVLELLRTHLITSENRLYDEVATAFRWLMATLFAANGGAIIALLGTEQPSLKNSYAALAWFGAGVFLSILTGFLSCFWSYRQSVRFTITRFKIERAVLEGAMDKEILSDVSAQKPNWKNWVPSYVGLVSFLCLIAGMLTASRAL